MDNKNLFVPVIQHGQKEDKLFLFRVVFSDIKGNESDKWHIDTGDCPTIKSLLSNVETYFAKMFENAHSWAVGFRREDNAKNRLKLDDMETSIMLGVFLAAIHKIAKLKYKEKWLSITATGTFTEEQADEKLELKYIDKPDIKFEAFKSYVDKKSKKGGNNKEKHLFLCIRKPEWEEKVTWDDTKICVKSFPDTESTLFDILDFVFELPDALPKSSAEKEREIYFRHFTTSARDIINKQMHFESPIYDTKIFHNALKHDHLFFHGQNDIEKSYHTIQLVRHMVWNGEIYAPICINLPKNYNESDNANENIPIDVERQLTLHLDVEEDDDCSYKLKNIPFLVIIDIPYEKGELDDFLERMKWLCDRIKRKSKIIFICTTMYDEDRINYLTSFKFPIDEESEAKPQQLQGPLLVSPSNVNRRPLLVFPKGNAATERASISVPVEEGTISPDASRPGWIPLSKSVIPLVCNEWGTGGITDAYSGAWYSFNVEKETMYYIWLNDFQGERTGTINVIVTVFYSNKSKPVVACRLHEWHFPAFSFSFKADSNDVIYIEVLSSPSRHTGSYGIAYSTDNVRPEQIENKTYIAGADALSTTNKDSQKRHKLPKYRVPITRRFKSFVFSFRGDTFMKKSQYDIAINEYTKAIKLNPRSASAYASRGYSYRMIGQDDEAISDFDIAIELNSKSAFAYTHRGYVYKEKSQYDKAISDFSIAIELNHQSDIAYAFRGDTYRLKGQHDKAISDFNIAIELNPKSALAYALRGDTFRLNGQYDKAFSDFNIAIKLKPMSAFVYTQRGLTYKMKSQYDKAISDFDIAIELYPKSVNAYAYRGLTYKQMGNIGQAAQDFEKALSIDSTVNWVKQELEKIRNCRNQSP